MSQDTDYLGVNNLGKNIKKSPMHQPNFTNAARQQPQPHVYNINKNDFSYLVQRLTASPSHHQEPLAPSPPQNPPKPAPLQLQMLLPPMAMQTPEPLPVPSRPPIGVPYSNNFGGPPLPQYGQPSPTMLPPFTPGDTWPNTAESPISAYMRYLQHSMAPPQPHPHSLPQGPGPNQARPSASGLLPNPHTPVSAYMRYLQHSISPPRPHPHSLPQGPGPNQAQPSASGLLPNPHTPISAYMRYLQHSIAPPQPYPHSLPQGAGPNQAQPFASGLLPHPHMPPLPGYDSEPSVGNGFMVQTNSLSPGPCESQCSSDGDSDSRYIEVFTRILRRGRG